MGYIFIISTPRRDRHGTVISLGGWKLDNYRNNPIVHWSERAMFSEDDPDQVIGTSRVWIENGKLYGEWTPDPTSEIARKIEKKLNSGTSLGASVNFLALEGRYGKGDEAKGASKETYYYSKQELLSWKIVAIPSNPECVYQKTYNSKRGLDRKGMARRLQLMKIELFD